MAPHAEEPFVDSSGYSLLPETVSELKQKLRLGHEACLPEASWVTPGPQVIDSHDTVSQEESPVLQLSLSDLREIEEAVNYFNSKGIPLNLLQAEHFPLPCLSVKLQNHRTLLPTSQPYFIIRGLKPQWFSKHKNVVIFTGIASHIGTKRAIARGEPNVLHHVTNLRVPEDDEAKYYRGPANRTIALPFHTDYGSIVSFYVLSRAASGGDIYLADIHDIVREIEATNPDMLDTLRKPFYNINAKEEGACDIRPLLFTLPSGRLAVQASRSRLFGTACRPRPNTVPPLSTPQVEAIDALHVAGSAVARRIEARSGDMLFFNNLRVMHARDAFVDGNEEENTTKRYILRLILNDDREDAPWEIPPELAETWKELYDHADEEEHFNIRPALFSYKSGH